MTSKACAGVTINELKMNSFNDLTVQEISKLTRLEVVPYYADLIINGTQSDAKRINQMILLRWKPSALLVIKGLAWKQITRTLKQKPE